MLFHFLNLLISVIHIIGYRNTNGTGPSSINHTFTYGYGRYEILAIFTNALCMIWMCLFIFAESIHRFLEPLNTTLPTPNNISSSTGKTIVHPVPATIEFGILGLILTTVGILFLRPGQGIWQQLSRYTNGSSSNSNNNNNPVNTITPPTALLLSNGNLNTRILFSHIYADGVSSLSLIAAGFAYRYLDITSADTLQAFFGACYIMYIAIPLFTATAYILLQTTPTHLRGSLERCRRDILTTDGVIEITDERYWMQTPGYTVGSLIIRIREDANEKTILERCQRTFSKLITDLTIQIEKDPPLAWLTNSNTSTTTAGEGASTVPSSSSVQPSTTVTGSSFIQIHTDH